MNGALVVRIQSGVARECYLILPALAGSFQFSWIAWIHLQSQLGKAWMMISFYIQFQFSMIREQKTEKFGAWKLKRKIILAGLFFIAIPGVLFWASEIGNWQTLVEFLVKLRIFFIQSNNSEYCREHSRILRKQISSSLNWIMAKQRQTVGLGLQSKTKHTPGQQEIKHWTYMKTQSGNM